MEKIIYKNKDVSEFFRQKENDIIELYARKKHKSFNEVKKIYNESRLKNVMDDLDNELWLESEYYILDSYENLMEKCPAASTAIASVKKYPAIQKIRGGQKKVGGSKPRNVLGFPMFDNLSPIYSNRTKENRAILARKGRPKLNRKNASIRSKARKKSK